MLTLKKFTKMRDDAMMIRVSVKTARMFANGFNTPTGNCLNSGIWIFLFWLLRVFQIEIKISIWKFLIFIFSEKKNSGKLPKFSEKNAGLLSKKAEKRTVVQAYFSI